MFSTRRILNRGIEVALFNGNATITNQGSMQGALTGLFFCVANALPLPDRMPLVDIFTHSWRARHHQDCTMLRPGMKGAWPYSGNVWFATQSMTQSTCPYSLAEDCRITSNNRVFGYEGPRIKADEDSKTH